MTKAKIHLDNYLEQISEGHFTVPYSTVIRLLDAPNGQDQQEATSLSPYSIPARKQSK